MSNTYAQPNDNNLASERPWWTVRRSLLVTLGALSLILASLITPTPLAKWVFGEASTLLARR